MRSMSITGSAKPACTSMSPQSCMSVKSCAGGGQPSARYSARSSCKVSGPRQENIRKPSTASARCHCAIRVCGSRRHVQCHVGPQHLDGARPGPAPWCRAGPATRRHQGRAICSSASLRALRLDHDSTRRRGSGARAARGPPGHRAPAPSRPRPAARRRIHCSRSSMRRPTSSCSQGERAGATRSQCGGGSGVDGGRAFVGHGASPNEYIEPMLRHLIEGLAGRRCPASARYAMPGRPSRCARPASRDLRSPGRAAAAAPCRSPPASTECGALPGAHPPPLDACHAAVSYEFPWSALIAQYKFNGAGRLGAHASPR